MSEFKQVIDMKKRIFESLKSYTYDDIKAYVDKWVLPDFAYFIKLTPPIFRMLAKEGYEHYKEKSDLETFILLIRQYRPDLIPILESKRGSAWIKIMHAGMIKAFETL